MRTFLKLSRGLARAASLSLCCAALAAAAPRRHRRPAAPRLPGARVQFVTSDSWTIVGTYSPPKPGMDTILFLHGLGSGSYEWIPLASRLAAKGYGTLAYDGRGHGASRDHAGQKEAYTEFLDQRGEDNEWNKMTLDVDAALAFLASRGVAASSAAFCGASVGANVMLKAASQHPEAPFLLLFSPGMNFRDVLPIDPIREYGRRPLLIAASLQDDDYALQSSQILYKLALPYSGADNVTFLQAPDKHGAPMLADRDTMERVLAWVDDAARHKPYADPVAASTAPAAAPTPPAPAAP